MRAISKVKQSMAGQNISESGLVSSGQGDVHPRLEAIVRKHLETHWSQPLHLPTLDTWHELETHPSFSAVMPLILDSGCGTGESTTRLAQQFPSHLVIGVDRSIKRLAKSGVSSAFFSRDNFILVRAELATFWRLLLMNGFSPQRHYLFYPNPWPKPGHLPRRWHGHPVFPDLLALGGEIELRCNWSVYALEFARAAGLATQALIGVVELKPDIGISPFERKYLERGQSLYSVLVPAQHTQAFRFARRGS